MTHIPTAPLSDLPRIIRENLVNCRKHDFANAALVLSREMLEELDGVISGSGGDVSGDNRSSEISAGRLAQIRIRDEASYNLAKDELHVSWAEMDRRILLRAYDALRTQLFLRTPPQRDLPQPMEWQSAVGDGRMNNDWQLYVDGSLRRYIENRFEILERRIAELEKRG